MNVSRFRFLSNLGSVFTFIVQDVESKMAILEALIAKDVVNFLTVNSMIKTEYSTLRSQDTSGCRTFLRLHRALKFLYMVFEGLVQGMFTILMRIHHLDIVLSYPDNGKTLKTLINESYDASLAPFHSWIIRKGVKVAVNFLPYKEQLIESVIRDQPPEDGLGSKEAYGVFMRSRTIPILKNVFDCCEDYYTKNKLHDLP